MMAKICSKVPGLNCQRYIGLLRIDNSRRCRIHSLWNISRNTKATTSCDTSNERADFSACADVCGF